LILEGYSKETGDQLQENLEQVLDRVFLYNSDVQKDLDRTPISDKLSLRIQADFDIFQLKVERDTTNIEKEV
jgi:hypothetical protein